MKETSINFQCEAGITRLSNRFLVTVLYIPQKKEGIEGGKKKEEIELANDAIRNNTDIIHK